MKKLIFLVFPLLLASCFGPSNDEVQKAKDELLSPTVSSGTTVGDVSENETQSEEEKLVGENEEPSYYNVTHLTSEKFIDIEPITNIEKITDTLDIKGIVNNPDIEKIKVSFKNQTSKFPVDENYELKTFKKGDKNFLYRAHTKYEVLDVGLNTYTIDAYVGENLVSKIEVEVFIADPNKKIHSEVTGTGSEKVSVAFTGDILEYLPTNTQTYGAPTSSGDEGVFTYSNISDFQGSKNDEIIGVTCENLAEYLKQNYTWYYWNTCRPITDDNNFSVNVLSLSGDEYKYERHYVIAKYGIYAKLLLDSGTGLLQADLPAKNDELKAKTFDTQIKADSLMKDLLR